MLEKCFIRLSYLFNFKKFLMKTKWRILENMLLCSSASDQTVVEMGLSGGCHVTRIYSWRELGDPDIFILVPLFWTLPWGEGLHYNMFLIHDVLDHQKPKAMIPPSHQLKPSQTDIGRPSFFITWLPQMLATVMGSWLTRVWPLSQYNGRWCEREGAYDLQSRNCLLCSCTGQSADSASNSLKILLFV